jgi:nicotinamide mononucleotide transporter
MRQFDKWAWSILTIVSSVLLILSIQKRIPISLTEVLGFVTGAICVLLVVGQNTWNFPIGIANNIFFIILFISSRLYGDMVLQGIYIILGIIGWWQWLYGGANHSELKASHTTFRESLALSVIGLIATVALREYLIRINDSSPFLDALTTVLSLCAQYLLNYKRIENWYIWITADAIYILLYIQKNLYLTAVLYALFIFLCISGLIAWYKAERQLRLMTNAYEAI